MKKADLYIRGRCDTPVAQLACIVQQEKALIAYCAAHQIEIRERIYDNCSAGKFEREGWSEFYNRLIFSSSAKPDFILFTSWDRFSRNLEHLAPVKSNLNSMGITVMPIDNHNSLADALEMYSSQYDLYTRVLIAFNFY